MLKNRGKMDIELIQTIFQKIANSSFDNIDLCIHGGEPLTWPTDELEKIINLERNYLNKKYVNNSLQTNGTLIDERFISFIKRTQDQGISLKLGLSIDGPELVHDSNRKMKDSTGSFEKITRNLELLQLNQIEFGILSVINKATLENLDNIYPFFKKLRTLKNLDFIIPQYFQDRLILSPGELTEAYIFLFDSWFFDQQCSFMIREFWAIINKLIGLKREAVCWLSPNCISDLAMVSIDIKGNIFPCDNYTHVSLGNIVDVKFDDLFKTNLTRRANALIENEKKKNCLFCKWYKVCNGGCPMNILSGTSNSYYCEDYQRIFLHIQDTLKRYKLLETNGLHVDLPNPLITKELSL
jgi:uncharacterized protein